jgi:hypothetical protein
MQVVVWYVFLDETDFKKHVWFYDELSLQYERPNSGTLH